MISEAIDSAVTIAWALAAWFAAGGRMVAADAPSGALGSPLATPEALKAPRVSRDAPAAS